MRRISAFSASAERESQGREAEKRERGTKGKARGEDGDQ
jgi:hypothetical protein